MTLKYNLFFKVLRKSHQLKDIVTNDEWRKLVIDLKCALSHVDNNVYNLCMAMAKNPERFCISDELTLSPMMSYAATRYEWKGYHITVTENKNIMSRDAFVIEDLITHDWFSYINGEFFVNGESIFTSIEAECFYNAKSSLCDMKTRADKIMKQNVKNEKINNAFSSYQQGE